MQQLQNAKKSSLTKESISANDDDQDYEDYNGIKMVRLPDSCNNEDQEEIQDEDLNDVQDQVPDAPISSVELSRKKSTTLQDKIEKTTYLRTSYPLMLKYDRDTSVFLSLLIDNEDYNEKKKRMGFLWLQETII